MKWIAYAILAFSLGTCAYAAPANCTTCNPYPCYSSAECGYGCRCMKAGNDLEGRCFNVQ